VRCDFSFVPSRTAYGSKISVWQLGVVTCHQHQKKTKPGRVTLERRQRAEMSAKSKVSAPKQSWFVLRTSLYDETETSLPQKK
jgi:hypothetical protein